MIITDNHYAVINSKNLLDHNISLEAKGLYAILMALEGKGIADYSWLNNFMKEDEQTFNRTLEELTKAGYVERRKRVPDRKIYDLLVVNKTIPQESEEL